MKRKVVSVVVLLLVLGAGYWMGQRRGSIAYAQNPSQNTRIKRSYGRCIGSYTSGTATNLVFENDDGRITFVSIFNGEEVGHFDRE
jgi:hypothetical protein